MNILLISPPIVLTRYKTPIFPLGLASIGTYLENHGYKVRLVDLNIWDDYFVNLKRLFQESKFDVVGVSMRNIFFNQTPQINQWKEIVKIIKSYAPYSKIVCGGTAFSLMPKEIMNYIKDIDIGIIGRGEESFLGLLQNDVSEVKGIVFRNGKELCFTSLGKEFEIEKLPIPKRDWLDLDLGYYPMLNIQTRRGCLFSCRFCSVEYLEGKTIKFRSLASIEKEISYLNSLGIKKLFFVDEIFNHPLSYSLAIIEILKKYDLEWGGLFRLDLLNRNYTDGLLKSNCKYVNVLGVSGSQDMHNYLKTGISVMTIYKTMGHLSLLRRKKVNINYSVMIGMPRERMKDLLKTFMLILRILLNKYSLNLSPFVICPKSNIEEELAYPSSCKSSLLYKKSFRIFYWLMDLINILKQKKLISSEATEFYKRIINNNIPED